MVIMSLMEFSDWINAKFIEWCGKKRRTITEFAQYLGVGQPSLSKWMNKKGVMPDPKSITKLAEKIGPEVYDVLGLVRPGESSIPFDSLPTDFRRRLADADRELLRRRAERNITNPDSPEAVALAREVFEQYGFTVTIIE